MKALYIKQAESCTNLGHSKNCTVNWLVIARNRLQFSIMKYRGQRHVLASRIQKTQSHRNEHGFFNWLPRSWGYILTAPSKHNLSAVLEKEEKGKEKFTIMYIYLNFKVKVRASAL